jgi:PTH1 family peptidyl-tRNA hydrolase
MKLIVGLGNPGKKYDQTWHNLGFLAIDEIQKKEPEAFCQFKASKKFNAEVCESQNDLERIVLAKPQTFMNDSGQSVKSLLNFYKIKSQDLWVIHDDIDLPSGKIRISHNSASAGHKGVQSIIAQLGTKDFIRFRLGIQKEPPAKIPSEKYVLQKIDGQSKIIIEEMMQKMLSAIEVALVQGIPEAMNEFN